MISIDFGILEDSSQSRLDAIRDVWAGCRGLMMGKDAFSSCVRLRRIKYDSIPL